MEQNCGDAAAKYEPGTERPVEGEGPAGEKCPCGKAGPGRSEKEVTKHTEPLPRKAAIVCMGPVPQTDTGG